MVYTWKVPGVIPVDAQTAGDELDRIYKRDGSVSPQAVVDDNRPEGAPLHGCFEWDDAKAAEKYRCNQASHIIRNVSVTVQNVFEDSTESRPVRAFVSTEKPACYEPIIVAVSDEHKYVALLAQAKRDMENFIQKYDILSGSLPVGPVIEAMRNNL